MPMMPLLFLLHSVLLIECQSQILSSVTLTRLVIGVPGGECVLMFGKTKTMTVSRSRTVLPSFPELTLNGVALKEPSGFIILGVTFDPKLSF